MLKTTPIVIFFSVLLLLPYAVVCQGQGQSMQLPDVKTKGNTSLEEALQKRRSVRSFTSEKISLNVLAQLLWAGNGWKTDSVTSPTRTAPSAGGLYPIELFVCAGKVGDIGAGIYHYESSSHSLRLVRSGNFRAKLAKATLGQSFIADAPVSIIVTGVYERTVRKYGKRGEERYVHMDAGHSAENIFLQAAALDLGTVTVGAFNNRDVKKILQSGNAAPLYIMPIGYPD